MLQGGQVKGKMTSWVTSPRLEKNIGFAMLPLSAGALGNTLDIETPEGSRAARVVKRPFIDPERKLSRGQGEGAPG